MKNRPMDNKAIIFVRVSSHRQQDGISFDAQESEGIRHAKKRGLDVVGIERIVESAKDSSNRKKFHALIKRMMQQSIRHLIFYQMDRESRNLTDNEMNESLIRQGKLVIHYARENKVFDLNTPDSEFFMRDIHAVTNRNFIRNLSTKVIDSMREKAEQGWFPSNHTPMGYVHHHPVDHYGRKAKRNTVIIADPNPQLVKAVQLEFELRAQNLS